MKEGAVWVEAEEEDRLCEKRFLVGEEDLVGDLEGDLDLVGDLEKEGRGERGGSGRSYAVEGDLAVEDAEESCFSGLSFSRSFSLSFLKMWASWTISVGAPRFFFFLGGDRKTTKAVETRKSGGTEPRFGSGKATRRGIRRSSRCKKKEKKEKYCKMEKQRKCEKEKSRSGPFSHDQVINLSEIIGH